MFSLPPRRPACSEINDKDMKSEKDYYAVLGVAPSATPAEIKEAFKKLALQYHPDRNKSADANERMSELLKAYQALNNPEERKNYDAQRKRGNGATTIPGQARSAYTPGGAARGNKHEVSPGARRDRLRHYAFPAYRVGEPMVVDLGEMSYTLSSDKALTLAEQGLLRGNAPRRPTDDEFYCHRCHHHWSHSGHKGELPQACPKCHVRDWQEYLLLRCSHCKAIFESEQIRYEIGAYTYSKPHHTRDDRCPPYELFPLCPYCGQSQWCPAENHRVSTLRKKLETQRLVWISTIIVFVVVVGIIALGFLR
ncbi:DnaJ domain-containing protein [Ktedonobacter robiniae]|uniref:J domain-containing protein n=1 Tax=Ktedonobacter robiniae TaxID=2778365 RepID=A0ABQ3UNU3_9CHLR|nr:DnaJ domain-containing protein [Ktedonobacter robiniae]GHO54346.1 hypothetical protein KSB_28210 [Ktedonobacter robiniae]